MASMLSSREATQESEPKLPNSSPEMDAQS